MHPGIGAAIRVDFRARITGFFLQEFDGTTGSVGVVVEQSQGGPTPVWTRISPLVTPAIVTGRYYADEDVTDWLTLVDRGDYLRFLVASATTITRVHVGLRVRRLEP